MATRLPSGKYRAQVYVGKDDTGKRIYEDFIAETKAEADAKAAIFRLDKTRKKKSNVSMTLSEAIDQYIEDKGNMLSPSTIRGYRIQQRNAYPLIIDTPLKTIAAKGLIAKQININAQKYAPKTLKNQYGLLTAIMHHFGAQYEQIQIRPQRKKIAAPTKQEAEEILALLSAAPEIECQILLAATCSLRQSEIYAITVDKVHGTLLEVRGARVPNEHNQWVYKDTNKSEAGTRMASMPQYLATKMADRCKAVGQGYLFDLNPNQVLYRFHRLLSANGYPAYTVHAMRHYFAALLHYQGVPDKYIQAMGGWSSDYVLKQIYEYEFEDELARQKAETNSYFDDVLKMEMQHDMQHEKDKTR